MYKSLYLNRLQDSIRESYRSKDYTLCESLCKQQISINEFDETAYKYLMHIYSEKKQYAQALQIYNHLEELLTEELFETPGDELQKLAASIEEGWNKNLEGKRHWQIPLKNPAVSMDAKKKLNRSRACCHSRAALSMFWSQAKPASERPGLLTLSWIPLCRHAIFFSWQLSATTQKKVIF